MRERGLLRMSPGGRRRGGTAGMGSLFLAAGLLASAGSLEAQSPPFSSTLRYGSGYFDVPVALVLPNLAFRASYSAFRVDVDGDPEVDDAGAVTGTGAPRSGWFGDAVFGLGLWDRVELGTSLQSLADESGGGTQAGLFGKLLLASPSRSGFALAVGGRYVGRPAFGDGVERAPSRLGFGDPRLRASFTGGEELNTRLSLYGVASLFLPGVTFPWLPENQVNLTAGYGNGMFSEGGGLEWYAPSGTGGWFFGGGWEVHLGPASVMSFRAEHNGFDVNAGMELAWRGARIGLHGLGLNHPEGSSVYRSRKLGIAVSFTACPLLRRACRPELRVGAPSDTIRLPAPPPDTVRVQARPTDPGGRPVQLCLSTGEDVWARVTSRGDTVWGPWGGAAREPSSGGRPPGRYAWGAEALAPDTIRIAGGVYRAEGEPESPTCAALVPWRDHRGIPLFRLRDTSEPPDIVLLPLAPGVWQRMRRTSEARVADPSSRTGPVPAPG